MTDWVQDINNMHNHYEVHEAVAKLDNDKLKKFLQFRIDFLQEELDEGRDALTNNDPEEAVDFLIDIAVVTLGTLDLMGVDSHKAWKEVLKANMNKKVGIKESRPNELGLPDLIKPSGWSAPDHGGNHGKFADFLK